MELVVVEDAAIETVSKAWPRRVEDARERSKAEAQAEVGGRLPQLLEPRPAGGRETLWFRWWLVLHRGWQPSAQTNQEDRRRLRTGA